MNEYFDEWEDDHDYSVSHRKVAYVGKLMISFRTHIPNRLAQKFRYEKIKHFLI